MQGSFASSGVLFAALTKEYGWSRATISLPFSVALVGYASLTWLSGRLFNHYWHDHWGSYHGAFALTMGVSLLGCLALWLAAPRHSRRTVSPPAPVS